VGLTPTEHISLLSFPGCTGAQYPATYAPVQRFECGLTTALAWLGGAGWFAIPYLCDFFHHCSQPVYPDAIPAQLLTHLTWALSRRPALVGLPLGRSQATKFKQQPLWVGPFPTGDQRGWGAPGQIREVGVVLLVPGLLQSGLYV